MQDRSFFYRRNSQIFHASNTKSPRSEGRMKERIRNEGQVKTMRKEKKKTILMIACCVVITLAGACKAENKPETTGTAGAVTGQETTAGEVQLAAADTSVREIIEQVKSQVMAEQKEPTGTILLKDGATTVTGTGCTIEGAMVKITEAGVYKISGTLSNGSICVDADKDSEVQLMFNGVSVHNESGAALFCKKAKQVIITLVEGTENCFTDGTVYVLAEGEEEPDATLFAKSDLIINGTGKLTVTGSYLDGIKGKDSFYILGGDIEVSAKDDAIVGKDLLYVEKGTITVTAGGDGLKSTNDTDETKGNVVIDGGKYAITSETDGIQAENCLTITGGEIVITAGDDGLHAEQTLGIGGESNITITKSNEGIEGFEIIISGGTVDITAKDDGVNVAGGNDTAQTATAQTATNGTNGRQNFGKGGMFEAVAGELFLNGGMVTVNAGGDGLDSNGNITMNGGTVIVYGPTGGGNGVLDYAGTFLINGGTLLAMGTSDMAQTPANTSEQYSLAATLTTAGQAGNKVEIVINDTVVTETEAAKQFNYIVASSPEFVAGAQAVVKINGETVQEGALGEIVTCFGFNGGMGGFGGMGSFGGQGGFGGKGDKGTMDGQGGMGGRPGFGGREGELWPDGFEGQEGEMFPEEFDGQQGGRWPGGAGFPEEFEGRMPWGNGEESELPDISENN